jgi:hypothetical protein
MTRQYYQDPNYNSGHHHAYQAPYYYPNPPQQPGPSTQPFKLPFPDPRDTYNDRSSQPGMSLVFETLLGNSLTWDLS